MTRIPILDLLMVTAVVLLFVIIIFVVISPRNQPENEADYCRTREDWSQSSLPAKYIKYFK